MDYHLPAGVLDLTSSMESSQRKTVGVGGLSASKRAHNQGIRDCASILHNFNDNTGMPLHDFYQSSSRLLAGKWTTKSTSTPLSALLKVSMVSHLICGNVCSGYRVVTSLSVKRATPPQCTPPPRSWFCSPHLSTVLPNSLSMLDIPALPLGITTTSYYQVIHCTAP